MALKRSNITEIIDLLDDDDDDELWSSSAFPFDAGRRVQRQAVEDRKPAARPEKAGGTVDSYQKLNRNGWIDNAVSLHSHLKENAAIANHNVNSNVFTESPKTSVATNNAVALQSDQDENFCIVLKSSTPSVMAMNVTTTNDATNNASISCLTVQPDSIEIGRVTLTMVDMRFCSGNVHAQDPIVLQPDSDNSVAEPAVRVYSPTGEKCGYIHRRESVGINKILTTMSRDVQLQGQVGDLPDSWNPKTADEIKVQVTLYARRNRIASFRSFQDLVQRISAALAMGGGDAMQLARTMSEFQHRIRWTAEVPDKAKHSAAATIAESAHAGGINEPTKRNEGLSTSASNTTFIPRAVAGSDLKASTTSARISLATYFPNVVSYLQDAMKHGIGMAQNHFAKVVGMLQTTSDQADPDIMQMMHRFERRILERGLHLSPQQGRASDHGDDHRMASITYDEAMHLFHIPTAVNVERMDMDWASQQRMLDNMFDEQLKVQLANLPEIPMPRQFQHITLYDYQCDGIRWLVHQERRWTQDTLSPFFERQAGQSGIDRWYCSVTRTHQSAPPKRICGGVLADDMGLGKTLQALGLILCNPPTGQTGYPFSRLRASREPRCTLIVCPLSVMANWNVQIQKHVNRKQKDIQYAIYHGPNRHNIMLQVNNTSLDIMICSYHTLVSDLNKLQDKTRSSEEIQPLAKRRRSQKAPSIFSVEFHRVILDEAHIIRNSDTGFYRSVMNLKARHKLCLTGTPFVNRPEDVQSLLSFLEVQPLCQRDVFKERVRKPIEDGLECGLAILRTTMAHVALRRNKANVSGVIELPKKEVFKCIIAFPENSQHKAIHDALYQTARLLFRGSLLKKGIRGVMENYMVFLELILRVRQSACHFELVPEDRRIEASDMFEEIKNTNLQELNPEECQELLKKIRSQLGGEDLQECAVCMNELEEATTVILRGCKHIFCQACLNQISNHLCPMCRNPYTEEDMVTKTAVEAAAKQNNNEKKKKATKPKGANRSPKIQALLDTIDDMDPNEKGVIFSQWTSFLDLIEVELDALGHTYTRLDGTMNAMQRCEAIEAFETEGCYSERTPRFILCSLHACGTGINLTRGNVVFMMDPWWNAASEDQAMNRVHRIGQTREVRVYRLFMQDSLEYRLLALQTSKAALGKGSMEKLSAEEKRKARITALKDLFECNDVEELWENGLR